MNKTLLKSVREYKKQSVLAPFFVILEVLMEVLIPMEMAKIIDVGIMQGNLSYIVRRGSVSYTHLNPLSIRSVCQYVRKWTFVNLSGTAIMNLYLLPSQA